MTDFIYIDGVEYKPDKELIDLIKNHANSSLDNSSDGLYVASYRVGCNKCRIYFTRNSEFRLVDGQLNFKVNGYDLAVNLWNTRAKIVDNSEDVNSFVI